MRRLVLISLFINLFCVSYSQNHNIIGLFPTYNQNGNISNKLDYSIYSFLAVYPVEQQAEGLFYPAKAIAFYIELDAIYNVNKNWSFVGSYTYEKVNPFRTDYRHENRIWLQTQYAHNFDKFNIKNRLRYDFRFIQNRISGESDFRPRLRYLLGIDFPINDKSWYCAAYNEFFFDTYSDKISAYSENWLFAGVGFNLCEKTKLETGPLVISWIRNSQKDWLHQYFWQMTLITQINLKKD